MHRFYADESTQRDDTVCLSNEDAHHAFRVLRLQPGNQAQIFLNGERWQGEIAAISAAAVECRLLQKLPSTEAGLKITLFQGLPKADKMEWIVQKATELGVTKIVPVAMKRCVVQLDAKDGQRKQERWQKIVREATKQSGRCILPEVTSPITVKQMKEMLGTYDGAIVPWEEASGYSVRRFHQDHPEVRSLAIVIGPEGGIAPEEVVEMNEAGCRSVTLGPRILRTQTAGLAAITAAMCLWNEMQ